MRYIIFLIVFWGCKNSSSNGKEDLPIGYKKFSEIARENIKIMSDSSGAFSISSAINIVKIHNTMRLYEINLIDSTLYNDYEINFSKKAFDRVIEVLEMNLSLGMSYYSKKYDLNMGAFKEMKNSYFELDIKMGSEQ